jgi:hypothetical protein
MSSHFDIRLAVVNGKMAAIVENDVPIFENAYFLDSEDPITIEGVGEIDDSMTLCEECVAGVHQEEDVEFSGECGMGNTPHCSWCGEPVHFSIDQSWLEDQLTQFLEYGIPKTTLSSDVQTAMDILLFTTTHTPTLHPQTLTIGTVLDFCEKTVAAYLANPENEAYLPQKSAS